MAGYFILAERPVKSCVCPGCLNPIKAGGADAYMSLMWLLVPDYQVEEIQTNGGRSYEKISEKFLHRCLSRVRSSARWGRDSLCPAGAAFVSTMPAPSGFLDGAGCEKIVGS